MTALQTPRPAARDGRVLSCDLFICHQCSGIVGEKTCMLPHQVQVRSIWCAQGRDMKLDIHLILLHMKKGCIYVHVVVVCIPFVFSDYLVYKQMIPNSAKCH